MKLTVHKSCVNFSNLTSPLSDRSAEKFSVIVDLVTKFIKL